MSEKKNMKFIQLNIHVTEDLNIRGIHLAENTTCLPGNSETIKLVAIAVLKALYTNKESIAVQETLDELGIDRDFSSLTDDTP